MNSKDIINAIREGVKSAKPTQRFHVLDVDENGKLVVRSGDERFFTEEIDKGHTQAANLYCNELEAEFKEPDQ